MAVQIIIDSAADYDKQEIEEKGLTCVPLTITFGEKSYRDCLELTKEAFYGMLLEKKEYPKTSQPSPDDFLQHFIRAKENGDSVVAILLSAGVSGTYQSANIAKQMAEYENIYLIDSATATSAIRILVEKAIEMREDNRPAAEIAAFIEKLKHRVKIYAAVDTLEYLYRGGRVTRAQAGVGELARLKPLITLTAEGKVEVWSKCIGGKKAMAQLLKMLAFVRVDPAYEFLFVYSHDRENCEKFQGFLAEKGYDVADKELYSIGSTIGAHTGSGAFGFIFVEAEES